MKKPGSPAGKHNMFGNKSRHIRHLEAVVHAQNLLIDSQRKIMTGMKERITGAEKTIEAQVKIVYQEASVPQPSTIAKNGHPKWVEVIANRDHIKPGETAEVLVHVPFRGERTTEVSCVPTHISGENRDPSKEPQI